MKLFFDWDTDKMDRYERLAFDILEDARDNHGMSEYLRLHLYLSITEALRKGEWRPNGKVDGLKLNLRAVMEQIKELKKSAGR